MKKNLITTAILLSTSAFISAEENANLAPINVYSAYATTVSQDQTASSITVLTEKDFEQRNATYVSDVLKTVPGAVLGATGGRGAVTSLFLRGAESKHSLVVIDGVKVNPASGYGFDFGGLSLSNIERIEILRGEQSALWGSDAMGGVVYITTKSGLNKDKPFNVDFDFGTGSHRTFDGSTTISGYQNGFYYALHGDSHRTKGISVLSQNKFNYTAEDGTEFSTGGAVERDKFRRDNTSLRFGYDDGNKGAEFLSSHYSQSTQNDTNLFTEPTDKDYIRVRETIFKLSGYMGNEQELIKQKVSVNHTKHDYNNFSQFPYSTDWKRLNANYQLDINFDREGDIKQAVSLLSEYQKTHFESSSFKQKKLAEKSLATEYRLITDNDHSIALSGRYLDSSQFKNNFTGRLAMAYRLTPNVKTHASFGTAVKNPTVTEYYGYGTDFIANPNLKPERSRGGEIGILLETDNKNHSLDVTYFARIVDDFIKTKNLGNNRSSATNIDGKTKIEGVEIAYNGKLTSSLSAYGNYTFTQTKDSQNQSLIRSPKHLANAGLNYQVTEKVVTTANVSYMGKRVDEYWGFSPAKRVKLPSYTLVNLGADYEIMPNLKIYANVNNLFNKKYENVVEYGQDGRNVYVGLKGTF